MVFGLSLQVYLSVYCFSAGRDEQTDLEMCLLHLNLISKIITYIFIIWLRIWKLPWAWWSVSSSHGGFSNVRNVFCLNSRNPKMGFPIFKILQGEFLMYSGTAGCCLPWDFMLPVQDCSNWPGESKQDIPDRSCWNGTVSIRLFSWKLPKGKHPLVTQHRKHPDPTQSSAISWVCWSIENIKLLKDIYEIQSLKNALQSESMWL